MAGSTSKVFTVVFTVKTSLGTGRIEIPAVIYGGKGVSGQPFRLRNAKPRDRDHS